MTSFDELYCEIEEIREIVEDKKIKERINQIHYSLQILEEDYRRLVNFIKWIENNNPKIMEGIFNG